MIFNPIMASLFCPRAGKMVMIAKDSFLIIRSYTARLCTCTLPWGAISQAVLAAYFSRYTPVVGH